MGCGVVDMNENKLIYSLGNWKHVINCNNELVGNDG